MRKSAGILLYHFHEKELQVLLVHHGGPFWQNKDLGSWSIVKGEFTDETPLEAALREFKEETGMVLSGNFIELTPIKQKAGKLVHAFALQGDLDVNTISCNTFRIEWPPRSGNWKEYPEIDKAAWFSIATAKEKINTAQLTFLDELVALLNNQ